jgi:hypothetical protein
VASSRHVRPMRERDFDIRFLIESPSRHL